MPHYADGTPAKHGDLIVRYEDWSETYTVLILATIQPKADTCNATALPLVTKQKGGSWYPSAPLSPWTVTLKECMLLEPPDCPQQKE
jgi:hypothetical protein